MGSAPRSAELAAASERLADSSRRTGDGFIYRLSVTSSDGEKVTVTWQIDTHRPECRKYVLREISHQFRVDTPEEALTALTTWSKSQLVAHLSRFPKAELLPPSMRR